MPASKVKVLFVDDDRFVRESFAFAHEDYFNLVMVESGKQALRLLKTDKAIGVAVIDVRMPVMDGLELARLIRESWPEKKIIIHTTNMSIANVVEGINEAHVDGFIEKVAADEDALEKVRTLISLRLREYEQGTR